MMKTLIKLCMLLVLVSFSLTPIGAQQKTLAERLGYKKTDKILIVNNDDSGMCHAANLGTIHGMEQGLISSSTIMTPCSWFPEITEYAIKHPERGFGVHLTHTCEWKNYRWGTVAPKDQVPTMYDSAGYMWKGVLDVHANTTPEDVLKEGRAQIEKAINAGIPVTHIDSHMGTVQTKPELMDVYMQLAVEYDLPLRMASQKACEHFGFGDFRKKCAEKGLVFTDDFVFEELQNYDKKDVKGFWTKIIKGLKPGVTELYIHGSQLTDELKAITASATVRADELKTFSDDPEIKELIQRENIILISYKPLRELQRRERKNGRN